MTVVPEAETKVNVLYASATGTAEDLSADVFETLEASGANVGRWCAADEFNLNELASSENTIVIFVVSTCGDGVAPRHLQPLWTILRRADLPPSILSSLRFAVFGLGDSAYPKFNAAARRLFARLVQLSAVPLVPLHQSLGDESASDGLHGTLIPWLHLIAQHVCPQGVISETKSERESSQSKEDEAVVITEVEILSNLKEEDHTNGCGYDVWKKNQITDSATGMQMADAIITDNFILTNSDFLEDDREVRHIELEVSESSRHYSSLQDYKPGDVLHVMPRNRPSAVDAFFSLMPDLDLDPQAIVQVQLVSHDSSSTRKRSKLQQLRLNIKTPCSVRELVSAQFDLWAIPQRRFLRRLAVYATEPMERDKLLHLASADGADDLVQYAYRERRTVLMTLRDFPSARPSFSALIQIMPRIRPRAFSIASSPLQFHSSVSGQSERVSTAVRATRYQLCVARVRYVTPLRFQREGLCSGFLSRSKKGDVLPIALERAQSLRFYPPSTRPTLLIAAGTGIAPMRSFLMHYSASREQEVNDDRDQTDKSTLIFGCRSERGDYLYRDDLERSGATIITAFSREQQQTDGKKYVQHRLAELKETVWDLVHQRNGIIYVAGAAGGMPKGVREALVNICNESAAENEKQYARGEQIVRRLEINGQLQMECW